MANVKHQLLSAPQVKALNTPGTYTDGATLTLRVSKTLNKRWVQRITIQGKQRNIGLGGYPTVGLAEARGRARRECQGHPCRVETRSKKSGPPANENG